MKNAFIEALGRKGYSIRVMQPDDLRYFDYPYDPETPLPAQARTRLRPNHPRLEELRQAYAALDLPVCAHTLWDAERPADELALLWFRGDNAYLWQFRQLRGDIRIKQYLGLRDIESRDTLGLLNILAEDGAFGCWTFRYGQRSPVSRDLLESINEINFLQKQLGITEIPALKVLDIGAGYGRLAHRMSKALPNLQRYDCVDAIPESTFLCEYYLAFREVTDTARAIPLHQLDQLEEAGRYDLAVNIHSFSECTREAICWWLDLLARLRVPYLLIVPNHPEQLFSYESYTERQDYAPDIAAAGFELIHKESVYNQEIHDLIGVRDHFFLYKQRNIQNA